MALYKLLWEIELDADSAQAAADEALAAQRDPDGVAVHFKVHEEHQSPDNALLIAGRTAQQIAIADELAKVRWGEWGIGGDVSSDCYDGIEITANELVIGAVGGIDYSQDTETPHMISVYLHLTGGGVVSVVDYPLEQRHVAEALAIGLMVKYPNLRKHPPDGLEKYTAFTMQETSTIIAALRRWQHEDGHSSELEDIATNGGTCELMTKAEVDVLIEDKVNVL